MHSRNAGGDYGGTDCGLTVPKGSHTRSPSFRRPPETRALTSDGQPENVVGRFWSLGTGFKQSQVLGRLDGPHREQARSHRKAKARSKDRSLRQLLHDER